MDTTIKSLSTITKSLSVLVAAAAIAATLVGCSQATAEPQRVEAPVISKPVQPKEFNFQLKFPAVGVLTVNCVDIKPGAERPWVQCAQVSNDLAKEKLTDLRKLGYGLRVGGETTNEQLNACLVDSMSYSDTPLSCFPVEF